jgi:hypothetical protein
MRGAMMLVLVMAAKRCALDVLGVAARSTCGRDLLSRAPTHVYSIFAMTKSTPGVDSRISEYHVFYRCLMPMDLGTPGVNIMLQPTHSTTRQQST